MIFNFQILFYCLYCWISNFIKLCFFNYWTDHVIFSLLLDNMVNYIVFEYIKAWILGLSYNDIFSFLWTIEFIHTHTHTHKYFYFCPHTVAWRILVPWPGIEPRLWQWNFWILTTGPLENSCVWFFHSIFCFHKWDWTIVS